MSYINGFKQNVDFNLHVVRQNNIKTMLSVDATRIHYYIVIRELEIAP